MELVDFFGAVVFWNVTTYHPSVILEALYSMSHIFSTEEAEITDCTETSVPICLTTRTSHSTILGIILRFNIIRLPSSLFPVGVLG
jgi:hypothetical protein